MFGTENSSGKSKGYSLVLYSPLLPSAMEYEDPHLHTHAECVYMRDRELENTLGTAACS